LLGSDPDAAPVRSFLSRLAGSVDDQAELDPLEVRRANHETGLLRTEKP
jgi:hypothetical protein